MRKIIATIFMIWLSMPMLASAQDANSAPVPELKDFKLDKPQQTNPGPIDPEPLTTKPTPEIAKPPVNAPKPVVARPQTQPNTAQPKNNGEPPKKSTINLEKPKLRSDSQTAATSNEPDVKPREQSQATQPTPEAEPADTIAGQIVPETNVSAPDVPAAPEPKSTLASDPIVPAMIGAGIVAGLILLGWLWTRRRRPIEEMDALDTLAEPEIEQAIEPVTATNVSMAPPEPVTLPTPEISPAAPQIEAIPVVAEPVPAPLAAEPALQPAPEPAALKATTKRTPTIIDLAFTPDRIVISFTSLTLYGDLAIHNRGKSPAFDVQLQTALISANENQHYEIKQFLINGLDTPAEPLHEIAPDEKLNLALALVLPLAEVNRFALGSQMLTVPILLARLDYGAGKSKASPRIVEALNCLIGREASPPQPKMGPLRLDLGARSYTGLGQRSLLA